MIVTRIYWPLHSISYKKNKIKIAMKHTDNVLKVEWEKMEREVMHTCMPQHL